MRVSVRLLDGMTFVGSSESGHGIVLDASPEVGGSDLGPRPMEVFLIGAAACTAFDVAYLLRKWGRRVDYLEVSAEAERAQDHPRVFTRVTLTFRVRTDATREDVERAVRLSQSRYCSAFAMIRASGASVEYSVELV